jgi:hypothetical protein
VSDVRGQFSQMRPNEIPAPCGLASSMPQPAKGSPAAPSADESAAPQCRSGHAGSGRLPHVPRPRAASFQACFTRPLAVHHAGAVGTLVRGRRCHAESSYLSPLALRLGVRVHLRPARVRSSFARAAATIDVIEPGPLGPAHLRTGPNSQRQPFSHQVRDPCRLRLEQGGWDRR